MSDHKLLEEIQYMETYINEEGEKVLIAGDWDGRFYTGTKRSFNAPEGTPSTVAFYDKQGINVSKEKSGGNIVQKSDTPWHDREYHPFVNNDRTLN